MRDLIVLCRAAGGIKRSATILHGLCIGTRRFVIALVAVSTALLQDCRPSSVAEFGSRNHVVVNHIANLVASLA